MQRLFIALFALCASATALALEVGGVRLDDRAAVGGKELQLNGAGIRTRLMFKVYVASLYLPQRATDPSAVLTMAPRRIQMNLLRNLSPDQLVDALVQGLNENNPATETDAIKAQTEQLVVIMKAFKEVKEKDVVVLDFIDRATVVLLNGESRGTIGGEAFNKALTRIWIGDKPVQADLKKAMLGG